MRVPKNVKGDDLEYLKDPVGFYAEFGIKIVNEGEDYFEVELPEGYTSDCSGYWTSIRDETGKCLISIFHKMCAWDYDFFARRG